MFTFPIASQVSYLSLLLFVLSNSVFIFDFVFSPPPQPPKYSRRHGPVMSMRELGNFKLSDLWEDTHYSYSFEALTNDTSISELPWMMTKQE